MDKRYVLNRLWDVGVEIFEFDDMVRGGLFYKDTMYNINDAHVLKLYSEGIPKGDCTIWSDWKQLDSYIVTDSEAYIYLKVKYIVESNYSQSPVELYEILLSGDIAVDMPNKCEPTTDVDTISVSISDCSPFDMVDFNHFSVVEQGLNRFINNVHGIDVIYISYDGADNLDVVLKEYSSLAFNKKDCIKVVIDQNKLPDYNHQFSEWGLHYDDFTVYVDKTLFKAKYGKSPAKSDVVIIPLYDRIYQVSSSDLKRGLGAISTFWELTLRKYDKEMYRDDSMDIQSMILDSVNTIDDYFGPKPMEQEIEDVVADIIHTKPYLDFDEQRYNIDENVIVMNHSVCNEDNIILGEGFYWMKNCKPHVIDVLKYKPLPQGIQNFGILFYFNIHSYDGAKLPSDVFNREHLRSNDSKNHVLSIGNISLWYDNNSVWILNGATTKKFTLDEELKLDMWYGFCVNYSIIHDEFIVTLWLRKKIISKFTFRATELLPLSNEASVSLGNSDTKYTAIRVSKIPIPHENQQLLLDSKYINNNIDKFLIIDDVYNNQVPLKMSTTYEK